MEEMQILNSTKYTTLIVFVAFFLYTLYEFMTVLAKRDTDQLKREARQTLLYIVGIATTAYAFIAYNFYTDRGETFATRSVRYLDWIITTPLITYSYYLIGRLNGVEVNLSNLLTTNLLFVGMGVIAEYFYQSKKQTEYSQRFEVWFSVLSFIFFGLFLFNIYSLTSKLHAKGVKTKGLEYFFYIGWSLYGVVFLAELLGKLQRDAVITSYAVLDFVNKIVYSAVANRVIN